MNNLKVGDKVRVKENLIIGERYGNRTIVSDMADLRGKIVTISKAIGHNLYNIAEDTSPLSYDWTEEMFEPVSFGKHLLRDGVIVRRRDDTYAIVIGDYFHSKTGYSCLSSYDDSLYCKECIHDELDIMAIYKPIGRGSIDSILDGKYLMLISERPAEVKEMTLEEICKELGYNVKIVKEA